MDENYPNRYLSHYLLIQLQFKNKENDNRTYLIFR